MEQNFFRSYEGAQDRNGNTIIPLSRKYTYVEYFCDDPRTCLSCKPPYFLIKVNNKMGVCTVTGKEIIAPKYATLHYSNEKGGFVYSDVVYDDYDSFNKAWNNGGFKPLGIALNSNGEVYYTHLWAWHNHNGSKVLS